MTQLRQQVERALAETIQHRDAIEKAEGKAGNWSYINGEANGLCIVLRLMGGYEDVTFDSAWAKTLPAQAADEHEVERTPNPPSGDEE